MSDDDKITLTFTRREWRVIVVALAKVKRSAFIRAEPHLEANRLALAIAEVTGKE